MKMWGFSENSEEKHGFLFIVIVLLVGVAFTLGKFYFERQPYDEWARGRAEKEAEKYVLKELVGARKVGSANAVPGDGANSFQVNLTVDGLNKFGGPARDQVSVEMKFDGERWHGSILSKQLTLAQ